MRSWELRARRRVSLLDPPEAAAAPHEPGVEEAGERDEPRRGRRRCADLLPPATPPRGSTAARREELHSGGGRRWSREAVATYLDRAPRQEGPVVGMDLTTPDLDLCRRGRAASAACSFDGLCVLLQSSALLLQIEGGEAGVRDGGGEAGARAGAEETCGGEDRGASAAKIEEEACGRKRERDDSEVSSWAALRREKGKNPQECACAGENCMQRSLRQSLQPL